MHKKKIKEEDMGNKLLLKKRENGNKKERLK